MTALDGGEPDRIPRALSFYRVEIETIATEPWAVVAGIELRSMTVLAHKGKEGPCMDHREAVVYRGPWKEVVDDDGHVLRRGERAAVCRKTFSILTREPYAASIVPVAPRVPVADAEATPFACARGARRDPRETKAGAEGREARPDACCAPDECC